MSKKTIEINIEDYNSMLILSEAFKKLLYESNIGATVIDNNGEIIYLNETTKNRYPRLDNFTIGKNIVESFPKSKLLNLLKHPKNAEKYSIESFGNKKFIINRFPIIIEKDNAAIGAFSTTKNIKYYQELELNIRKQLQEKGHVAKYTFDDIITQNKEMSKIISVAKTYANSIFPVLIQGETGTGKELFAQSIHNASDRNNGPFVALNCSTLTESILETELFGYSDSSFTGAKKGGKSGLFQEAHKGTIFLDEIGEMPLSFQSKLLRVLQENEVRPVGSQKIIPIDVRVIAATNRDLKKEVDNGNFRLDLWYRLNVLCINIIPLRKRIEDIEIFTKHFLTKYKDADLTKKSEMLIDLMKSYSFPGNVRELINILDRFFLNIKANNDYFADDIISTKEFFESYMREFSISQPQNIADENQNLHPAAIDYSVKDLIEEQEKEQIKNLLVKFNGSRTLVAEHLNISISTLRRRIVKYQIK